ncbi:MAG: hypothetical protein COB98_10265 [Flavobacteriaceae bacterium]|nr:MAG: hypothetical protein COB98_10265 [Flavobacteriaceae bacterium]
MIVVFRRFLTRGLGGLILLFISCEYDTIEYPDVDILKPIGFRQDILPLFKSSCVSCHNNASNPPVLVTEIAFQALINGNYLKLKNPEESRLMRKLYTNHPDNETPTKNELQMLLKWMKEGALNN